MLMGCICTLTVLMRFIDKYSSLLSAVPSLFLNLKVLNWQHLQFQLALLHVRGNSRKANNQIDITKQFFFFGVIALWRPVVRTVAREQFVHTSARFLRKFTHQICLCDARPAILRPRAFWWAINFHTKPFLLILCRKSAEIFSAVEYVLVLFGSQRPCDGRYRAVIIIIIVIVIIT